MLLCSFQPSSVPHILHLDVVFKIRVFVEIVEIVEIGLELLRMDAEVHNDELVTHSGSREVVFTPTVEQILAVHFF